ncbi:MAG: hypothetical protein AB4911_23855, partial [Oscillochloridaceae bacterium umkhey_bin13]
HHPVARPAIPSPAPPSRRPPRHPVTRPAGPRPRPDPAIPMPYSDMRAPYSRMARPSFGCETSTVLLSH